jgi:uncharacterized membrane protein affecting hemolysin expression
MDNKALYLHPHSRKEKDSIAQLVEHITFNDGVLGSSPSRVTISFLNTHKDSIAQLVEHITFNDGVLGSSPSRVTKSRTAVFDFFCFKATWRNGRLAILRGWCS